MRVIESIMCELAYAPQIANIPPQINLIDSMRDFAALPPCLIQHTVPVVCEPCSLRIPAT
jgi:hypothetical protein